MHTLYIKQRIFKITDNYPIKDDQGKVRYQVDQDFKLIGDKIHVTDPNGEEVFTVKRKLIRLFPTYSVAFADGQSLKVRSQLSLMRRKVKVSSDDFELKVRGNLIDHKFTVSESGEEIGTIRKKLLSIGDSFEIQVKDRNYEQVLVAITIAIDNLMDREDDEEDDE